MNIREQIKNYRPWNEQERQDQAVILAFLEQNPDAFYRTNLLAHMTASAWVVNRPNSSPLTTHSAKKASAQPKKGFARLCLKKSQANRYCRFTNSMVIPHIFPSTAPAKAR